MFIDIHTHNNHNISHDCRRLFNLHNHFENTNPLFHYSLGIHPWHINKHNFSEELSILKKQSIKNNVLAIGECGLDRLCETNYKLQQEVFVAQILLANEIAKPIIIHAVRTHDDILQMLKDNKNIMPVIFHGFNKNVSIAQKIIQSGYYISIGKDVTKIEMEKTLNFIPLDKIFLETDNCDLSIENIYKEVSRIRNIPFTQLILQIQKNFKNIFKTI